MPETEPTELLPSFSLPEKAYQLRAVKQGLIHQTFLVLHANRPEYVLQQINTSVFRDIEALMGNLRQALPRLGASDYQQVGLVKTRKGGLYLDSGDAGCWRMMTYVPGSVTFNTTSKPNTAREAGRIIGRFHSLLQGTDMASYRDTLPGFHNLELRAKQYDEAMKGADTVRKDLAAKAIRVAEGFLKDPFPFEKEGLPIRICHNDTKLNNILFSENSSRALCLVDLDTIMKGYFMYDFGDAIRTIVNTVPEDERLLEKIRFSRPLFRAFIDGLSTQKGLLSMPEIHSLPHGAVYMPFLHGLRALTDYLSGDVYYQVAYEGQNLDRSMSLLTFAGKAREELDFMQRTVEEFLT